jgi:4'-phosphopantetheinyl transferase
MGFIVSHVHFFEPLETWPQGEVWRCDLSKPPSDESLWMLSGPERGRAQRFLREPDRHSFIGAHVALRRLLAAQLAQAPEALEFATGPFGKPFLDGHEPLRFNLSHSHPVALVALSRHCEVGIDIEKICDLPDADELVQHHFSAHEQQAWSLLSEPHRPAAFYSAWSRKEACVKALGWGLSMPLETVEVGLEPGLRQLELSLPEGGLAQVSVLSLSLEAGWSGAVAWVRQALGNDPEVS